MLNPEISTPEQPRCSPCSVGWNPHLFCQWKAWQKANFSPNTHCHCRETSQVEQSPNSSTPSPQQRFPFAGALSTAVPGCKKNRGKSPNGSLESWEMQGTLTSHPGDQIPAQILAPTSPSVSPGCTMTCVGCGQQLCRSLRSQHQLSPKYQVLGAKSTIKPSVLLLLTPQKLL